ncbi:RNA exonuclease 3 [Pichia californica]|uniref:RNA exonuclease 3 n=1 Tax=Pichia californica TaxID=460514 RepID=A0A9P6WG45_9ASCO|nr:RNA exonuclease 3 [[Candida] californica]KAG0686481.1 RNA exonuclease 3 [[Candida] californica]
MVDTTSTSNTTTTKLFPIPVIPFAPVRQDERQHYLNLLYNQYFLCNSKFNLQYSINQLIKKSINNEFKIAKLNKIKSQYQHSIKKLMFNLKKFGTEDGLPIQLSQSNNNNDDNDNDDNIDNDDDYYNQLKNLCIPIQRLKRNNYITEIPLISNNYKFPILIDCNHCGNSFNLNEISNIVSCNFHPGKLITSTNENINNNKGKKIFGNDYINKIYNCCNELKGQSQGCKKLNHHVFKLNNSIDLHYLKPFINISNLRNSLNIINNSKIQLLRKQKIKAIGLDCEMCYTDKGFELMKLSLIDFKTEKKILDSIIHPDGDLIIDLNSHVSGVNNIPKNSLTFDEAIIKLAQLTDNDTIIIGHGLENDLNVLRLIYPNIIDTAILFSENQIDIKRKDPLKKLAWSFLSENIQGKEHDSLEDALIPIKIVKKHLDNINKIKIRNKM